MFSLYCVCLFPTALQELKVCRTDTYVIYPKHSKFMSIIIKDLSYTHTDKEVLFPTPEQWRMLFSGKSLQLADGRMLMVVKGPSGYGVRLTGMAALKRKVTKMEL